MQIFVSVILTLFSLFNYDSLKISQNEKVRGIVIERKVPDIYFDSLKNRVIVVRYVPHYTKIYYYKNQVLLQSSYEYRQLDLRGLNEDEKQKYIDSQLYEVRYFSFIYSNDLNKGWLCDSNSVQKGRIASKDSLLAKEWIVLAQKHDILKSSYHTLISSTTSEDGSITEKYDFKNKADTSMNGSLVLVFSNRPFEQVEYSLSKETEQSKKMKLIKMITINDARYIPPSNIYIERVELSYELKKLTITNEKELIEMFRFAEVALR